MEIKKSPEADLNNKRLTFFLSGLVVALTAFYLILEWGGGSADGDELDQHHLFNEITKELDMIPMMKELPKVTPPQPKKEKPKLAEIKVADVIDDKQMEDASKDIDLEVPEMVPEVEEKNDPLSSVEMNKQQEDSVFRIVEQLPEYPGGITEFMKWLTKNLKYPTSAQRQHITGTCSVSFIVNKDGSISDIKVEKSLHRLCDAEAVRVLRMMPKWKPGHMKGEVVRTKVAIPIVFKI